MTDRLSTKATDTELETSNAPAKRDGWVIWFALLAFLPGMLTPFVGHLVRTPWGYPYVLDFLRLILVFSAVMIPVALWLTYRNLRRPRA